MTNELIAALHLIAMQKVVEPRDMGIVTIAEFKSNWDKYDNMNMTIVHARRVLNDIESGKYV